MNLSEWISIADKLPDLNKWVLLFISTEYMKEQHMYGWYPQVFVGQRGHYGKDNLYESAHGDGYVPSGIDENITHWTPIPQLPEINCRHLLTQEKYETQD